jgi:Protein of unknown function (DUF3443)
MPSAERLAARCLALLVTAAAAVLVACGGGSTSSTTVICKDPAICVAQQAVQSTPSGPNTTEIVVDSGPASAFSLGVTNVPYVTVTVCSPGSASQCATIDHVLLDTGSYGLRLLKSKVASLGLPAVAVAADAASGTPGGQAAECYAFVLGAVWGPLATADVRMGGEVAPGLHIQLIDDGTPASPAVPPNCQSAAQGSLLNSVAQLQANGILGIGMVGVDCGAPCLTNSYAGSYVVYYSCPSGAPGCMPAGLPAAVQVQNPITRFAVNNNGSLIVMPALPELGAMVAKGRLVFGIGTQANNQLPPAAKMYQVQADPTRADYLYVGVRVGTQNYAQSFIDTGSNALFFDDATLPRACNVSSGTQDSWYCPASTWHRGATVTDAAGALGSFNFAVASADTLFNTGASAFADLGGSTGQSAGTFALGLPFFYGRSVFTSIWGQALSANGPWYAF